MINIQENREKMKQYEKMSEKELLEIENDKNTSYNDYVLVCIARGLKDIESKKTYTTEEVFSHVYEHINMVARNRS